MPIPIQRIVKVAGDTSLHGTARNLFTSLALHADAQQALASSIHDLAKEIGAGAATISRSLGALERAGYIQRKRSYATERTTVNIAPPPQTSV